MLKAAIQEFFDTSEVKTDPTFKWWWLGVIALCSIMLFILWYCTVTLEFFSGNMLRGFFTQLIGFPVSGLLGVGVAVQLYFFTQWYFPALFCSLGARVVWGVWVVWSLEMIIFTLLPNVFVFLDLCAYFLTQHPLGLTDTLGAPMQKFHIYLYGLVFDTDWAQYLYECSHYRALC